MASKLTLIDISSGFKGTDIQTNFTSIEDEFDDTLSRSGKSPNTMNAVIDMNSFEINNLGAPGNNQAAARLKDVLDQTTEDATTKPATAVTVEDSAGNFTATNAEGALKELAEEVDVSDRFPNLSGNVTADENELNVLDGYTGSTADLNNSTNAHPDIAIGLNADGSTDDSAGIESALSSGRAVLLPATYKIATDFTVNDGETLVFIPGASLDIDPGVTIQVARGGNIIAPREHIFQLGDNTVDFRFEGGEEIYPEWFGVDTTNTAATNKSNWDKAVVSLYRNDPNRGLFKVNFRAAAYPIQAPFFLPPRMEWHGRGMWSTKLDISGTEEHGIEVVTVEGGAIKQDGDMSSSNTYSKIFDMEVDCTDISQTSGTRKAIAFMPGWSSGVIRNVRLNGPSVAGTAASLMDGLLLIPTYESGGNGKAAIRNNVSDMRITNIRDGIVVGRFPNTLSGSEPASGGDDMSEGGGAYETYIGPRIFVSGSWDGERLAPRYGIVVNRDDNTTRRDRPYAVAVVGNTFEAGTPPGFQGVDITKTNSSTTVTGTNTRFTEDIFFDDAEVLAMNFPDGDTLRVDTVVSDTEVTLLDAATASLTTAASNVSVRKGFGILVDSKGHNISVRDNYIDQWGVSIRATSNSKNGFYFSNDGAGGPWSQGQDNGTDNFFHHVGSGGVDIRNTPT